MVPNCRMLMGNFYPIKPCKFFKSFIHVSNKCKNDLGCVESVYRFTNGEVSLRRIKNHPRPVTNRFRNNPSQDRGVRGSYPRNYVLRSIVREKLLGKDY